MLLKWRQDLLGSPETSQILSQFMWYKKCIKVKNIAINIFQNSLIKVLTLCRSYLKVAGSYHGSILNWQMTFFPVSLIKICYSCDMAKKLIFDYNDINEDGLYQNHQVIKGARILSLKKLSCKEILNHLFWKIPWKYNSWLD